MSPHRKAICSLLDATGKALDRAEIIQQFPALIWHSGVDGRCDYFNQAWLAFTGRTLAQELGEGWTEGIYPDDLSDCLATYRTAFESRQQFIMEYRLRYRDGTYHWIQDHGSPHYAVDGSFCGYIGSCYDISSQKQTEAVLLNHQAELEQQLDCRAEELRQSYDLLQSISRQIPGGIYQFQLFPDGRYCIPYTSQSMIELFEIEPIEVQHDASSLFERVHPDDKLALMASIYASSHSLEPWFHEFRGTIPSKGIRWFQGNSRPQRQPDDSVIWCGFIMDITERKELELQLEEAHRLEYVGQLAAGVAHEVRNPLNAILTVTEALFREDGVADNHALQPYIEHIRSQVTRLARLMNDLLDLGRQQPEELLNPLELAGFCRHTAQLWQQYSSYSDHHLVVTVASEVEPLTVCAYPDRLQQVLFNLIDNACQNSPPGSTVNLVLDAPQATSSAVQLRVIDQGRGIADELLERVFEPFFTTRKGGTGLGLALVKRFVEQMGGQVRIRANEPGPGCMVTLQLKAQCCEEPK